MKRGQNVIILTMKESGKTYVFGSLSAIYGMFTSDELGITYSALRNAVSAYIKANDIDKNESDRAECIYANSRSSFTLLRAPLLLADKG